MGLEPGSAGRYQLQRIPRGGGPLREQPLEDAPPDPDDAVVFADLDPKLHGLPLGIRAGVLGERRFGNGAPLALSCSEVRSDQRARTSGGQVG
jgi:hypothetical protein